MSVSSISANWAGRDSESLLWLASYPRSGNTFTRILLANYFAAELDGYDINQLHDLIPPDTSGPLWTAFAEQHPIPTEPAGMWKARTRFIEHYRATKKRSPLAALKTHTAKVEALGAQAFSLRRNDRIIYIVRHPLDVALSYAHFNGLDVDSVIHAMCEPGFFVPREGAGIVEVQGSWVQHVSSWLNTLDSPVLLIRYEALCTRTEEILESILTFLGAPIIPERVAQAVQASRFDKMRAQEAAHRFNEAPKTTTFFRRGQSGQWLRELSPEQAYRLADGCEPVMTKLGYNHPRDVFFDGRNAVGPIDVRF
jgi:hypothetical protein